MAGMALFREASFEEAFDYLMEVRVFLLVVFGRCFVLFFFVVLWLLLCARLLFFSCWRALLYMLLAFLSLTTHANAAVGR